LTNTRYSAMPGGRSPAIYAGSLRPRPTRLPSPGERVWLAGISVLGGDREEGADVELIRKTVLAGAVAVLAVLLTAAGPAAGSTAVRVVPWEGMGWQNMMARPSAVYTGRHAPNGRAYMLFVTWDDWRAASAAGHGYVQLARGREYRAGIVFYRVRRHRGLFYFSRMTWTRHRHGVKEKTRWAFWDKEWVRTQPWHRVQ
jgi:hypothetical protein